MPSALEMSIADQSRARIEYSWREVDPFPFILHRMLGEMGNEGNEHIISWNSDGKSFTIHDPKEFAEKILTRYFKNQTRYKSFQVCRQEGRSKH
jgi:hypothetical protein